MSTTERVCDAGTVTNGVINEGRLGLDAVYVQAKRWAKTVGAFYNSGPLKSNFLAA